ncbi:MAG TPA: DUF2079 domain-containing protein [Polyangiaceae bacterium]|nr:DUF2079 domain-containing protein [Polyangiaceae bacterium]
MGFSASGPLRARERAGLFLEVAALGTFLLGIAAWGDAGSYAETNTGTPWLRGAGSVPWVVALVALIAVERLSRTRPGFAAAVRTWLRRGLPLLALWVAPLLFSREAFREQPLFLMLLTGAATLGLEVSLRRAGGGAWLARRSGPLASSRALPRLLAAAAILACMAFLYRSGVRLHDKFSSSNYDLGLFENLFWNTLHGRHGLALDQQYFAQHAEFLVYALLPVYAAFPHTETLFAIQAVLMAGAALPLFLLAERWLGSAWAGLVFVLAYLSHPAIHGPALYDFHFLPLAAFFLIWAAYLHTRAPGSIAFWVALVLGMCCREDVAIGVLVVGAGLAWNARRATRGSSYGRARRVGWWMAGLGLVWFVLVKFVWMRQFGPASFAIYYSELIPPRSRGFGAVLLTLVSNPVYTLSRLLTPEKCLLALQLLVPLAFLPVRYSRALFLMIPGLIVVGLADSGSTITTVHLHYATHFLPYVFIAAVGVLAVRAREGRPPALLALGFASLVSTLHFGAFFVDAYRTSFHDLNFEWGPGDIELQQAFERLAVQIPDDASVSAGEYEGAHLARRSTLISLKAGCQGADYVIYSPRSLRWGDQGDVERALRTGAYGVVGLEADLGLLARDYDTARNTEALRLLRRR